MKVKEAISLFQYFGRSSYKRRTVESYAHLLKEFETLYGERSVESTGSDVIYHFLENITEGLAKSTRRLRYAQLKAFYNFSINQCNIDMKNPCNVPLLTKTFKMPIQIARRIPDKEVIDEMIYNTKSPRDRLILELQARCGLRIGESLKIKVSDISERKIILREPKSGKDAEVAFMPEPIARRLNGYIKSKNLQSNDLIFPICYSTARSMIKRLGARLSVNITPHDLRRYSATYASRNGVPLEIVSKVILRHQDLKTTQVYLGKVSESEAIRWMDILHGK